MNVEKGTEGMERGRDQREREFPRERPAVKSVYLHPTVHIFISIERMILSQEYYDTPSRTPPPLSFSLTIAPWLGSQKDKAPDS